MISTFILKLAKAPITPYTLPMWLPFLLLLPLFLTFKQKKEDKRQKKKQLSPGPLKPPILGNLHQLGELLHQSHWHLSKKYGPVMFLHLGRIPTVIIYSAD